MSRFVGTVVGQGAREAKRVGKTCIQAHVRGARSGVIVIGDVDPEGADRFRVYASGGFEELHGDRLLATVGAAEDWPAVEIASGAALVCTGKSANGRPIYKVYKKEDAVIDRVQQVNWLREFAEDVATNLGTGSAEELVTYALSEEGRDQWQIELPAWFDGHDQDLLVQYVEEAVK